MRNGPFFCIQTFWRRFMVTNEAANSFPAAPKDLDRRREQDRKRIEKTSKIRECTDHIKEKLHEFQSKQRNIVLDTDDFHKECAFRQRP